jgi:hypothetical protein
VIPRRGLWTRRCPQKNYCKMSAPFIFALAMDPNRYYPRFRHMQLDASYYISRVLIPPLERIFNLVGADVRSWFDDMPKAIRVNHPNPLAMSPKKQRITANRLKIDEHFQSSQCLACGGLSSDGRHLYLCSSFQGRRIHDRNL